MRKACNTQHYKNLNFILKFKFLVFLEKMSANIIIMKYSHEKSKALRDGSHGQLLHVFAYLKYSNGCVIIKAALIFLEKCMNECNLRIG